VPLDERIEAEYREVLARPRLSIPGPRLEALLAALEFQDWTTALPLQGTSLPDRDDVVFLEVAAVCADPTVRVIRGPEI